MSQQYTIEFQPVGKRVEANKDDSVFEAARKAGIEISTACGGMGSCGLCRVEIISGEVTSLSEKESLLLSRRKRSEGERLSCCVKPLSNIKVQVPRSSSGKTQRLQLETNTPVRKNTSRSISGNGSFAQDKNIHRYQVVLNPPTLEDTRGDLKRLREGLREQYGLLTIYADLPVSRKLSSFAREQNWQFECYMRGEELVGLTVLHGRMLGMAVDVGSTKIASYLMDLENGEVLASAGAANPQIGYGEDVISRLTYVIRNKEGGKTLAGVVQQTLNDLLGELVREADVSRDEVMDLCIVGNTAITHLMLELPVEQLANSPFVASDGQAINIKARDMGIDAAAGAYVHVLPCIGGFVGADHVAMILASEIDQSDHIVIGVDIGTNTEIVLNLPEKKKMYSLSCPSGPAFEGAHISDGMRAAAGAIERVKIHDDEIALKTIDEAKPIGLCGSGIVDAIAELRRRRIINPRGRMQIDASQRVRKDVCGPEFILVSDLDSGSGQEVLIRQSDINEIQLAKGAIKAGIEMILEYTGTDWSEVEEVMIAGAFGSFLDVESAIDIGLFPYFENAAYTQVGNAAAKGAQLALSSVAERKRASKIATETEYLELTVIGEFTRHFARATLLPDDDSIHERHRRVAAE